jgi:TolB protein
MLAAPPANATFPGSNGIVAFTNFDGTPANSSQVFTVSPDGTGRTQLTYTEYGARTPRWSPDGTKIAFSETLDVFGLRGIAVINADGSGETLITSGANFDIDPAWSPDGSKIAFSRRGDCGQNPDCRERDIYTVNPDGSGLAQVTHANGLAEGNLDWSPNGVTIAFTAVTGGSTHIYTVKPDGTGQTQLTSGSASDDWPSWSPNGRKIAFDSHRNATGQCGFGCNIELYVMNADGTAQTRLTNEPEVDTSPAWSPDGTKLVFGRWSCTPSMTCTGGVHAMNADGTGISPLTNQWQDGIADWQPIPYTGYPRPRGASPMRVSLVPAYKSCTAPNRTHSAPLAFPSCQPPVQTSGFLTVGTPDANGAGVNSVGSMTLRVKTTLPEDVLISGSISDVRCLPVTAVTVCNSVNGSGGPDYSGELQGNATIRVTDHYNGPGGDDAATVQDISFPVSLTCANTAGTTIGGSCNVTTSGGVVCPECGIRAGKRTVVETAQFQVFDGGLDGRIATNDNTLFMDQGVFVP